ncbi:MAG: neutral/alkaline non-lysosomal ceramidase N-terminal domain-containing protein [Anaerolineae bacterium]|nr:neutral/alkaline non-lysosomal ceramidase N-terminal domain-containing protein [Anaerolineae bacterium]
MTESMDGISVGLARADITPPVGIPSIGFAARGPLTRQHDPLLAAALVFVEGDKKVALLACDLLGLDDQTVAEVRAAVQARAGIDPEAVMVTCTHTHYGPDAFRNRANPVVESYRANLIHILAGVTQEALANVQLASLGVGWSESDIGVNRREKRPDGQVVLGQNPGGPKDSAVGVLRIDALDGNPLACLVNFQCHPVSQTGQIDHISADYPGTMRAAVEQLTGATCLFVQGACGDINAVWMEPSYEPARTLGTRLGCEVVRVWEQITPHPASGLGVVSEVAHLPRMRYGSQENAAALVAELEAERQCLEREGVLESHLWWIGLRLERARAALHSWTDGVLAPVEAEIQALRVGDLGIVGAPGEIFNQIGVQVKAASPWADTFFAGYANGYIGYVPTADAYPDGGYEVTMACQVDPEAAGILAERCLGLLNQLVEHRRSVG